MADVELSNLMRTLLAAGFEVERVDRKPNFIVLTLSRADSFSIGIKYLLAYAGDDRVSTADIEALQKVALKEACALVIVSSNGASNSTSYLNLTKTKLFGLLGGVVSSTSALEPEYAQRRSGSG